MSMWRAWVLDAPTLAFLGWVAWFVAWETWALRQPDAYIDTWTAHMRPVFLFAPPTWWLGLGLYVWFGVHIFAPSLERLLSRVVVEGVSL